MVASASYLIQGHDAVYVDIHVQPGAKTTALAGLHAGALKVRISSPPIEGRANLEVRQYFAELFHLPTGGVSIQRGERGRSKRLAVRGAALDTIAAILAKQLNPL